MTALTYLMTAVGALTALANGLSAQTGDDAWIDALLDNTAQLQARVRVDRTSYFPGEIAIVNITVANTTASPLQVLAPFVAESGCLDLFVQGSISSAPTLLAARMACDYGAIDAGTPTTAFAPGEERRLTLYSYGNLFDLGIPALPMSGVPLEPGLYSIQYSYNDNPGAAFEVITPHLEAAAVTRVQDASYLDSGTTVQGRRYTHAFSVRWNGQSFICLTISPSPDGDPLKADDNGMLSGKVAAYRRIAVSQNTISSIAVTGSAQDNLTVTWTDSQGNRRTTSGAAPPLAGDTSQVQVWVYPNAASLYASQSQQFSSLVTGDSNTAVAWTVALDAGAPVGAQVGSISATGLYTAPSSIPSRYTVIVAAQSQADGSQNASAILTLDVPPTPTLTSISPASGIQGASVPVTLTGTSFVMGASVATNNPGIAVTPATVVSATQISVTLTIAANAVPGAANVTLTTVGGTSAAAAFTVVSAGETVSTPATLTGPVTGVSGTLYKFTASGSTSSLGHAVQYSFNWGDGAVSGWTPTGVTSSFHTWTAPGAYTVTVQARCVIDTAVTSSVSAGSAVAITGESISVPTTPAGPGSAVTGSSSSYSTGGSVSGLGHPVQYQLSWGDGSVSAWLPAGTTSASHTWFGPGTYVVTAKARCATDTQVLSPVSAGFTVNLLADKTISAPSAPTGPVAGSSGTSYSYSTGGAASSTGSAVVYLFDWGDGSTSGWLAAGATSASHQWALPGPYAVKASAADATNLLIQSTASSALTVSIKAP